jgi:adenylate cyclase
MVEESVRRRLAAILAADVVGYSRLIEQDEAGTLSALKQRFREILQPLVVKHHGRIVKIMGDGVLAEFASAVHAVDCAIQLQIQMTAANAQVPDDRGIVLRVGVNLGDVAVDDGDLFGDGVNVAARLEAIAQPGRIYMSGKVRDEILGKLDIDLEDLGPTALKNIAKPVHVYRVAPDSSARSAAGAVSMASLPLPAKPSIAVLPFTNMSGDSEQQYFSDGLTEDIITELSRFRQLFVIARNSSFQYRGTDVDLRRLGHELGVQYVVEGSVRKVAERLRITAQLIDAATGNHLWAERFDRDYQDVFAVQDEVTRTIVSTLVVRLEDESLVTSKRKLPASMQAYDYWLHGKNCLDLWTKQAHLDAKGFFEKAITIDPTYARAHAGLALTYQWAAYYTAWGGGDPTLHQRAETLALRAAELDPTDHVPLITLGWINHERRDFERARRYLDRAEALNPNDADLLINKAMMLALQGEPEAAIALARSAIRLNPHHPDYYLGYLSHCYLFAGRYEEAIALKEGLTNVFPEGRVALAVLYAHLGRMEDAQLQIDRFIADFPSHWIGRPSISFVADHLFNFKRKADTEVFLEALRKTGLPE